MARVVLYALAGAGVVLAAFVAAPLPAGLLDYRPVASVRVLDRQGGLLRELHSRADGRARQATASELPPQLRAAFLAAEDAGFERHLGISPTAVLRAAWQNLRARRVVAGGSTLTQQLARTLVPRPRTLWGKAQEGAWALRLEAHLSKEEILVQYLNRVPFGNNTFGVEAASELYFGRRAANLSHAQAAVLASLPRGPTAYSPFRHRERLERRKAWVLGRMAKTGALSAEEAEAAGREPLDLQAFDRQFRAPHFVEFVAAHLEAWGLSRAVAVETTLDGALQRRVEEVVDEELSRLAERQVSSAAVLVLDNGTGEVLAYQGSRSFFDAESGGQNDGVQMRRQPGSTLKPFAYGEAFSAGYTPATVLVDLETAFAAEKGSYAPKNYDRRLHGPVRAREALGSSFNVPAVRIAEELGASRLLETLRRAGFDSLRLTAEHYGLGLVLGNGEVSAWELARAYRGLAEGGVVRPLVAVRRAWGPDGEELPLRPELQPRRFVPAASAALVADILSDNDARARAFGLDNALRLPFPVAAKTGTSKGYSDNWTAGFTRERTVVAWAGNFDGTPMVQVSGITGAGPLFRRVMEGAMQGVAGAPLWDGRLLEAHAICPVSGGRAGPDCPGRMEERFARGTAPTEACHVHRRLAAQLPPALEPRCRELAGRGGSVADLGPEFDEWARAEGLSAEPWLLRECLEPRPGARGEAGPHVLSPADGDEYLLFPDMPLEDQTLPVRVRSPDGRALELRVDGAHVLTLSAPFTGRIPATRGEHRLTLHRVGELQPVEALRYRVRTERSRW
jgi:penicillin-binding protein 1C